MNVLEITGNPCIELWVALGSYNLSLLFVSMYQNTPGWTLWETITVVTVESQNYGPGPLFVSNVWGREIKNGRDSVWSVEERLCWGWGPHFPPSKPYTKGMLKPFPVRVSGFPFSSFFPFSPSPA